MRITIEKAVTLLKAGEIVAIPTETVYGLAAWLSIEDAVEKIFKLKKRPSSNPLIIHVGNLESVIALASDIPPEFFPLVEAFWPGPLTLILQIYEEKVPPIARAGLATAAFRMPKHPITLEILNAVSPLVAPSANLSGTPSGTRPEHIENDFGLQFPVVEGLCQHGLESTILAQKNGVWQIARLGAISREEIAAVVGYLPEYAKNEGRAPICPGQLFTHYAPKARLFLSDLPYEKGRCPIVLGFSDRHYLGVTKLYSLGSTKEPDQVAFRLYDVLRQLDIEGVKEIWVDMATPSSGIWQTIHERLNRASSQ